MRKRAFTQKCAHFCPGKDGQSEEFYAKINIWKKIFFYANTVKQYATVCFAHPSALSCPWLPAWGPSSMSYHQSNEKRFETWKKFP